MTRMQVFIPNNLYKKLKSTAKRNERPMADYIRLGLETILERKKIKEVDPMKDFVGAAKTNKKTDSVSDIRSYYATK